ncbi:MAG: hypothetical protein Q9222_005242 [Ikaeria aurantiellina]
MAPSILKKRKHEAITKPKAQRPIKKFKKQTRYESSSSSPSQSADEAPDFPAVDLAESDSEPEDQFNGLDDDNSASFPTVQKQDSTSHSESSASDSEATSSSASITTSNPDPSSKKRKKPSKRNDPSAFATSISSILSSKLPNPKRSDPVLARSSTAQAANTALREAHLEKRARQQIRAEKKALMEKGRVKDVLLGTAVGVDEDIEEEGRAAKMMEQERRLKKTAQRGVVKLFNAVRMAQVRGEEARREALEKGVVGTKRKEERVGEMSKKGFLELVASGGSKGKSRKMTGETIEEA